MSTLFFGPKPSFLGEEFMAGYQGETFGKFCYHMAYSLFEVSRDRALFCSQLILGFNKYTWGGGGSGWLSC